MFITIITTSLILLIACILALVLWMLKGESENTSLRDEIARVRRELDERSKVRHDNEDALKRLRLHFENEKERLDKELNDKRLEFKREIEEQYVVNEKLERQKELNKVREVKDSKTAKTSGPKTPVNAKDSVVISKIGQSLLKQKEEISRYLKELEYIKTSDEKTLNEIQHKVKANFYSKPSVLAKIAESILELPSFKNIAEKNTSKSQAKDKAQKMAEIKAKLEEGEYDSEDILEVIVNRLLNSNLL